MVKLFARFISTGFGLGYSPVAPGTLGSLATMVIWWFCPLFSTAQFFLINLFVFVLGILTAAVTEKEYQQKYNNKDLHDPGIIIIDEVAGMMTALFAIRKSLFLFIAAFGLFRFFDILKPFPIKKFEKLPSGWGIVCDDVLAGVFANVVLRLLVISFH